jgi:hypothetical protein
VPTVSRATTVEHWMTDWNRLDDPRGDNDVPVVLNR